MRATPRLALLPLLLLAVALPAAGKEESKIKVRMERVNGNGNGNGNGGGLRGDLRSQLTDQQATLQIKVRGLDPGTDHELRADGVTLTTLDVASNGTVNEKIDLLSLGLGADADPRGKLLEVVDVGPDPDNPLLEAYVFAAKGNDPGWVHIKEVSQLVPEQGSVCEDGSVDVRYDLRPNGKGRFEVWLRGLPGDSSYEVHVNGEMATDLTTNAGGNAKASFRTQANGSTKPHNKKLALGNLDPRLVPVDILHVHDDATVHDCQSGTMAAQIDGLNTCSSNPQPVTSDLATLPPTGLGVVFDRDEDCEGFVEVSVAAASGIGTVEVFVDGASQGTVDEGATDDFDAAPGSRVVIVDATAMIFDGVVP